VSVARLAPALVRLRTHGYTLLQDQLFRTAWPLVINTVANGLLGIAFWMLAARLYDAESVATSIALVSAMMTLSGICQLNLGPGLNILVPRAGRAARRVIAKAYSAVTVFAFIVLAVFFTLVLPQLAELSDALSGPSMLLLFGAAVLAYNVFALQDAALVSLRWGRWIPVENAVFGVLKMALLVPFAAALPSNGIFTSWLVPMLLIVPVVSGIVLTRGSVADDASSAAPPVRATVGKLALDYVGYLCNLASVFVLPVIALEVLPPFEAAVFGVAWLTSSTVDLVSTNLGTALMVETTYGEDPAALRRSMFRRAIPAMAAVALVGLVSAPLVLRLFGPEYAEEGADVLRVLLLATVPRAIVNLAVAEARAHGSIPFVVRLRAQNSIVALGLAAVLAPTYGGVGMALAWLAAQLLGGATALRYLLRVRPGTAA
jgi:hypothetical protein